VTRTVNIDRGCVDDRKSDCRALRVLYIADTMAQGGAGRSLLFLIQSLPKGWVEPHLLCPPGYAVDAFTRTGVRVHHVPGVSAFLSIRGVPLRGWRLLSLIRTLWFLRYGPRIRRVLQYVQPDLVHLNERGLFQAATLAHRAGIPVVMHARSVADRETWWIWNLSTWLTQRYVDVVIAISESVRRSLREIEGCTVIYNPLDDGVTKISPECTKLSRAAARTSSGTEAIRVAYVGNLLGYKGISELLEAARILRSRRDILFEIAGGNSRPKEFYRSPVGRFLQLVGVVRDVEQEAYDFVAREGLRETVKMLGHVEDVTTVLGRADILVFPSHLNAPGRSVYEAGARGIPAIVAMADNVEDIVVDGVTGLIIKEQDPRALAEAIQRLAGDAILRTRLGANAREKYSRQFDPVRIGRQVLDVYESLIANRPVAMRRVAAVSTLPGAGCSDLAGADMDRTRSRR